MLCGYNVTWNILRSGAVNGEEVDGKDYANTLSQAVLLEIQADDRHPMIKGSAHVMDLIRAVSLDLQWLFGRKLLQMAP